MPPGRLRGNIVATLAAPDVSDASEVARDSDGLDAVGSMSQPYEVEGLVGSFPRGGSSPLGRTKIV